MRYLDKILWIGVLAVLFGASVTIFGATGAQTINLPAAGASAVVDDDDEEPDVKARVARISLIRGDVKIKRIDNDQWEKAGLNLPLVEGDEIATGGDGRVELQFNNYVHLRLDSDAYLKVSTLQDAGVALSLTQGTLGLRITNFDKAGGYFEIDVPKTTVAIEKSGSYRIDAGHPGNNELHVAANNGGSARVYSETAGFTLKSGRIARVFLDGANAGDWETADVVSSSDEFETWSADRDTMIAKRLKSAHYDKYYDDDIYGAEDLDGNGEWINTSTYGYVWRPYDSAIAGYADWSPYRYGQWRWVPPFGWTWVNDEPWGWATYHHGRWVFDNGHWVWCPYSYYRPKRSWWFPAIVSINIIDTNVCWYPLGWHHRWHNYNGHNHGGGGNWGQNPRPPIRTPVAVNPGATPAPTPRGIIRYPIRHPGVDTPNDDIPTTGVITVPAKDFGTGKRRPVRLDPTIAKTILASEPKGSGPVDLPDRDQVRERTGKDIIAPRPKITPDQVKTGAVIRRSGEPLDEELQKTRFLGGRQKSKGEDTTKTDVPKDTPSTGAVMRPVQTKPKDRIITEPVQPQPTKVREEPFKPRIEPTKGDDTPKYKQPTMTEMPKQDHPRNDPPPTRVEQPRNDPKPTPPPTPKNDPPPRNEPKPVVDEPSRGKVKDGK
jgi:hypothetical protein